MLYIPGATTARTTSVSNAWGLWALRGVVPPVLVIFFTALVLGLVGGAYLSRQPIPDPKPVSVVMFTVCGDAAAMSTVFDTGQVIVLNRAEIAKLSKDFMDSLLRAVPDKGVAITNYAPVWCGIKS